MRKPGAPISSRILLAEDEEHIAKLVVFKLTKEGFGVTHVRDGQEALDRLGEGVWDLVILDVMMPRKNGWEVLQALRSDPKTVSIPVLMLTAKGYQQDISKAAELDAEKYLKKPFDPNDLAELVREMVGRR